MSIVEKGIDKGVGIRPADVPLVKTLLLLGFMAVPGKFIPWMIRWGLAKAFSPTAPDYFKKVDIWTQVLGSLAGFGAAYGVKKTLRGFLGERGAELMAVGTLAGSLDAGFNRVGQYNTDLTDKISHGLREKLLDLIGKIRGTELTGPGQVGAAAGRKTSLAGFPEAGTSAWREQQRHLASPQKRLAGRVTPRTVRTTGPGKLAGTSGLAKPLKTASPNKPIDMVQQTCEVLAAKSRM